MKDEYRDLVARLERGTMALPEAEDARAEQGRREILEILFAPEEAALASRLPVRPIALERLAARVGVAPRELEARLEPMCERGVVLDLLNPRNGKRSYMLAPPVVGFFEYSLMRAKDGIPKKRMAEALHAYTHGDPAFAREAFGKETVVGRALVHEGELADPPGGPDDGARLRREDGSREPLPDVLAWERASEVVGGARKWSVSLCFCRHKAEHLGARCDAPMESCLSLNGGAEFIVRRGFGREIGRSEALEILARARESGLVQIADNVKSRPTFVCNCCGCCCEQLQAVSRWGLPAVNPSGFVPRVDAARCAGCSRCARACPVGALAMDPVLAPASRRNRLVPRLDEERCVGCGVCAGACQKGALAMARGGRPRPVPANTVERVIRMALERNRLAELLVDEGAGLGARFLHRAIDAIVSLPPAQAALASEQVRSRFVRAALARFGKLG
jgi:NAD-dependent dihydropyrimidine dehydrogenase PreA subunit